MKFYPKESVILACTGLMAAAFSGCGGGGGGDQADSSQLQPASFAITKDNVAAIVNEEFKFPDGIQGVDKVTNKSISIPPTTLTITSSAESPTGYAFKMVFADGSYSSGNLGFGSCKFLVTKTTSVWEKKNEDPPEILTVGEEIIFQNCKIGLDGFYQITDQAAFEAEIMAFLGTSITDPVPTPVKVITKEDKSTVIINGQNVGDTRLEFITGTSSPY